MEEQKTVLITQKKMIQELSTAGQTSQEFLLIQKEIKKLRTEIYDSVDHLRSLRVEILVDIFHEKSMIEYYINDNLKKLNTLRKIKKMIVDHDYHRWIVGPLRKKKYEEAIQRIREYAEQSEPMKPIKVYGSSAGLPDLSKRGQANDEYSLFDKIKRFLK